MKLVAVSLGSLASTALSASVPDHDHENHPHWAHEPEDFMKPFFEHSISSTIPLCLLSITNHWLLGLSNTPAKSTNNIVHN